jgi:hypothetical protein
LGNLPSSSDSPPGIINPTAGTVYDVYVRVWNPYPLPVTDWNLFVCWAIPTAGPIPIPPVGQLLNGAPLGSPISVPSGGPGFYKIFKTSMTWTPSFENAGHECLVAVTYDQTIGFPWPSSLPGDAGPTADYSIGQHNLGVLPVPMHMKRFEYAFQVSNGADEEREFVVEARQAPLSEIAAFLPGVHGRRTKIDKPGKVERLAIVASAKPDPDELEAATAFQLPVKIAPRNCRAFTLSGNLHEGNALINVTQTLDKRVVGGVSVLVMSEET